MLRIDENPGGGFEEGLTARLVLPAERSSVADGREFIRNTLDSWGLGNMADRLVLVVSELVTNSVIHTRSSPCIELTRQQAHVRLEITDGSPHPPRMRNCGVSATNGRGMMLVESVADRWGTEPATGGKTVWCEFDVVVDLNA